MPARRRLPSPLDHLPFSTAMAREIGIGEGRMRGADLSRPFHGIRSPGGSPETVAELCRAYVPRMTPEQSFSHVTAAVLWGVPLPRLVDTSSLHVTSARRAAQAVGIIGHQSRVPRSVVIRDGFRVSSPETVFLELASLLEFDDLIAAGDALVLDPVVSDPHDLRPWATIASLSAAAATWAGPGGANARRAVGSLRPGTESRPETHLRLLAIRSGCGEPEINVNLYTRSGQFLGRGDLVYRRYKVLLEYDGDHHRTDIRQYEKDIARIEAFIDDGWIVIRVRKRGLYVTPELTVARLERAVRSRGWVPEPRRRGVRAISTSIAE